jgi:7-cyano-7-deazaguanine synthase in queuosine biosynthesis
MLIETNPMTVKNSQEDIVIDITEFGALRWEETVNRVGIRISGGADSAILAYMLAVYKRDYRPHLALHPITCINDQKPYQEIFAKQVLSKITELTGVEFDEHFVENVNGDRYREDQGVFQENLYKEKKIDIHYMGETMNPPIEVEADWKFKGGGRDNSRDEKSEIRDSVTIRKPFRNLDKKGIAELYQHFGVMDTLFPLTRSCEIHTLDFSNHCDQCWFCLERKWGFGRYV